MRRLVLALLIATATPAAAQSVLVLSQNKCAFDKQGQIQRMLDSVWTPIAQELVNEGRIVSAGSATHAWGDEWNVVQWYVAPSIPNFLTAFAELMQRLGQRHPTVMPAFTAACTEHKDSFLTMGMVTTPAPAPRRP